MLHQHAVNLSQMGKNAEALKLFKKSLEVFDDNALTDYMIGRINLQDGNCVEAMKWFNKIQAGHGIGIGEHNHALITNDFAFAHVCNKSYEDAVALFESELTTTKQASYFLNAYAHALNEIGQKQKALNAMQDAIALFPTHIISWLNFGRLCFYGNLRDHFVIAYKEASMIASQGESGGNYLKRILDALDKKEPMDWIFFHAG